MKTRRNVKRAFIVTAASESCWRWRIVCERGNCLNFVNFACEAEITFLAATPSTTLLVPRQPLNVSAMAPIRRYLRITKYSVLECRIYLDNPALAESWLLNSRNPILPRVIESVRPLVLPKLREENERSKGKGGKKKGVKDVVVEGTVSRLYLCIGGCWCWQRISKSLSFW
jgi:hypothetical protein